MKQQNRKQWRSLASRDASAEQLDAQRNEFPEGAGEMPANGDVSRRAFLGLMGASTALAGIGLQGCVRKPTQYILPYAERPEDLVPGRPRYFATTLFAGGTFQSALIESHDNRPTKLEGNPRDLLTQGASSSYAQAEVLRLYDIDRLQSATKAGAAISLAAAAEELSTQREALAASAGEGFGLVFDDVPSPSLRASLAAFAAAYPQAKLYASDQRKSDNARAAWDALGDANAAVRYDVAAAKVIVSLDSDFLLTEENALANAAGFAAGRAVESVEDGMNRLYAVEPGFSSTGMNADNHLTLAASQVGPFAKALAAAVDVTAASGATAPAGTEAWVTAVADDLKGNRGASLVIAGERQPAWVHALAFAMNTALGNVGQTVRYLAQPGAVAAGTVTDLAADLESGAVKQLITLDANVAYTAPGALGLGDKLAGLESLTALSYYKNPTTAAAGVVLPLAHPFEAWGDLQDADGRRGIQQPIIAPLFEALSAVEVLEALTADEPRSGYDIVRDTWRSSSEGLDFGASWNRWLHDGVASPVATTAAAFNASAVAGLVSAAEVADAPSNSAIELAFCLAPSVLGGQYANNGWLQELPNPITKLTWDNAAVMSYNTAEALGIDWSSAQHKGVYRGTLITLTVNGASVTLPSFVQPGVADGCIMLDLGYGQETGQISTGAGVDVRPLQGGANPAIASGATVAKAGGEYILASTQDHWSLEPRAEDQWPSLVLNSTESFSRPLVREATLDEFRADPDFVEADELMAASNIRSLWTEPNPVVGQQWGMTIDLGTCIGCGACSIACQAENNIPVVGKDRILEGRELHWIRIDRYFVGDIASPEVVNQPIACMQCETAPCEQVCPVAATVHSPSGLNDMVYNRCIGTRYCGNNCPYKVRRFNFFSFSKDERAVNPLVQMQRNPDVTPRFRGVMEKCSYCVQRINHARIDAKVDGDGIIPDGAISTACEQACPSSSIIFGDISDPNSAVSAKKRSSRDYALLSFLNTKPRTTYLAKLRNPNPELV